MPVANNGGRADYGFNDTHPWMEQTVYRIRAVSQDSRLQYSSIAGVDAGKNIPVFPTPEPVSNSTINLAFYAKQPKETSEHQQTGTGDIQRPGTGCAISTLQHQPSATLPVGTTTS